MTFNTRTIGYAILALLFALIVSQLFHVGHAHGDEIDVAAHIHTRQYLRGHHWYCWCGELYSMIADMIRTDTV